MNMKTHPISTTITATGLFAAFLACASTGTARSFIQPGTFNGDQPVNVSVNFNIQLPLQSLEESRIVAAQMQGRALIYRLARNECEVLLEEIAGTCRLTGLNASTQIPQVHNTNPLYINLSGNAQFAISLKRENRD
jgi:hypothetical protein